MSKVAIPDSPERTRVRLGHADGDVTTYVPGFDPGHDDIDVLRNANHDELNDHSKAMRTWLLSLPDGHQPYWTHLHQLDELWPNHSEHPPVWVSCPEHPDLEQLVADHFSGRGHTVQIGDPDDGAPDPPAGGGGGGGGGGGAGLLLLMMTFTLGLLLLLRALVAGFTNDGKRLVATMLGDSTSFSGTTTSAPTATTVSDTGKAFPTSTAGANGVHTGGLVGHTVRMATAYGIVISNTATVLTIDMWHTYGAPDTVATTPSTGTYEVLPGAGPACFTGVSTATRAFNAADQMLSNDGTTISELFFSGGGLKRKLASYAYTGTGTFTYTTTWTANGSDTLPQTIGKWGVFPAEVTASPTTSTSGPLLFNTNPASTATLAAVGDNVTFTDTVTES